MIYLFAAYTVFWVLTFGLVFSIFSRQRAAEQEMSALKSLAETDRDGKDGS